MLKKLFEARNEVMMEKEIERLKDAFASAETVIIGAGAGMSTSAGFTYSGERFDRYFGDFAGKYHFKDMYEGGFFPYGTPEESWAFWSRNIFINRYMKAPRPVYDRLFDLVDGRENGKGEPKKDYFILTTNVDHQFQKAGFDKKRMFYTQGDYGLWQCSRPCHKRTYDNKSKVVKMLLSQGFSIGADGSLEVPVRENAGAETDFVRESAGAETDFVRENVGTGTDPARENTGANAAMITDFDRLAMTIPSDLVPYCPVCGEPMAMNLRADDTFVEDDGWHEAAGRFADFLEKHEDTKTLFLELGTGFNTPGIIKYRFWQLTKSWPDAVYCCLNRGEAAAPPEIRRKSICIDGDIGDVLAEL